jgi:hypothetical protein
MGSNPSTSDAVLGDLTGAPPSGITRRSFLAAANALTLIALLEACTGKHHPAAATGSATGSASASATAAASSAGASATTADFLATLRQAVQASPDFLQQAAAKAVATKDIATITAFVRDRISVIPSWGQGDNPVWSKRWGSRATLRGGSGTLRDRADLLAELLTAAGFSATVMSADLPSAIDLPTLYQVRATDFEPDATLYAKAVALLPPGAALPTSSATASSSAPAESPAEAAASALAAAIPTALQSATIRKDLLPASVPVVAVGVTPSGPSPSAASTNAAQQYLFALGSLTPSATAPSGLATAVETPTPHVSVTVFGLTNPAPGSTTPSGQITQLVTGAWPAEQVFGRQVMLNFVPPSGAIGFLTDDPATQPIRVPMLRVQSELAAYAAPPIAASSPPASTTSFAPTASAAASDATQVFTGPPITLQGDVLSQPSGGSDDPLVPVGAYGPMTTLSAGQLKDAIASAATLQATARATTFPDVELDVAVLDSAGNSVDGLDAAAFSIADNGTTAPSIALMSNAVGSNRPRVLVIYDTTGSVEQTWPSAAAKATFEQSLSTTLVAAAQQAPFDVQVLGLDDSYSPDSTRWVAPDQAGLIAAFANARGNNSIVWAAASGGAIDQGVVAMVMVSDFVSGGELPADIAAAQRRIAAARIPVICLTIGKPDATAVSEMVTLSGGTRLDPLAPTTSSAIAALIKPLVAARTLNSYRMRYTAPTGVATTHTVTVTLTGRNTPVGTATYTAPTTPSTPWSFAGLYVRMSVGGYDTGMRHLAGLNLNGDGWIEALDDAAAAAETRAAICGLTTIAFEPGSTTAAAILDDLIASAQSVQPVVTLPQTATAQDIVTAAAKDGVRRVPAVLVSLLLPAAAEARPAAVPTMRVAILQERGNASGGVDIRMDLPPAMNTMEPLGTDPVAAFGAALASSSNAAAAEATNFNSSAFSSLAGRPLVFLPASDDGPWDTFVKGLPAAQQPAWDAVLNTSFYTSTQHALVPTGGATAAFWVVDTRTGAATAVLLDGSGGALTNDATCSAAEELLSEFLALANSMITAFTLSCIATSLSGSSAFFCVGKASASIYQEVGVVLAVIGGPMGGVRGIVLALVSIASLWVPFGPTAAGADTVTYAAAQDVQAVKFAATFALGVLGGKPSCAPAAAPPPTPDGGSSVEPPPMCSESGAEDGVCR